MYGHANHTLDQLYCKRRGFNLKDLWIFTYRMATLHKVSVVFQHQLHFSIAQCAQLETNKEKKQIKSRTLIKRKDKFKEAEDINCITLHSHSIKSFVLRYPPIFTFINWIMPSGIVVLLSRLKYSMISLVWKREDIISILFAVVNFRVTSWIIYFWL